MDTNKSESYSNKDFKDALLELKTNSGLSYMAIAIKAGLSDSYLVNIVNGKNLAPTDENITKIAAALNVKPEYFKEYRNRRLFEKMLQPDETDIDTIKSYNIKLSPNEVKKLEVIISELKEKYDK